MTTLSNVHRCTERKTSQKEAYNLGWGKRHTAWRILPCFMFDFLHISLSFQHSLCKYQLNWWSFKFCFWTINTVSALHTYCCLSQEECSRFFERLPTHRRPIWRLEKLNWEHWLQRGRTGFHLKMNVRSLSNSCLSSSFLSFWFLANFRAKSSLSLKLTPCTSSVQKIFHPKQSLSNHSFPFPAVFSI